MMIWAVIVRQKSRNSVAGLRNRSTDALLRPGLLPAITPEQISLVLRVLTAEVGPYLLIERLPRIARSHRDPHFSDGHPDLCADLQQLRPDGRYLCLRQFRALQPKPPQGADQHIGHRRKI